MTDFDPALVEKAARALYEDHAYPTKVEWAEVGEQGKLSYRRKARAVLAAVADWMNNCDTEALRRNAMHDRLVQEARSEGARQVFAAVEAERTASLSHRVAVSCVCVRCEERTALIRAAREAVARIEKESQ